MDLTLPMLANCEELHTIMRAQANKIEAELHCLIHLKTLLKMIALVFSQPHNPMYQTEQFLSNENCTCAICFHSIIS